MTDYTSWRCYKDTSIFCPPEGCSASYGCAREKGWKPGDKTPEGCDGTRTRKIVESTENLKQRIDEWK